MTEAKDIKFCLQRDNIKSCQRDAKSPPKVAWLWSSDPLKFLALS